jgi:acyl-CoA thioesterase
MERTAHSAKEVEWDTRAGPLAQLTQEGHLEIFNSAMVDKEFSAEAILARVDAIPSMHTFGYRVEEIGPGRAVMVAPYDTKFDGIFASFHGGLLAMLADSTGGTAVLTVAGADAMAVTTDLSIRFLAPCRTDARATAKVIKAGQTLVVVEIDIHDMEGRHVAVSQASYLRRRKPTTPDTSC